MIPRLFDGAVDHLTRGIAFATRRHEVLTQNIANLETPGYRARDVVFEDVLTPLVKVSAPDGGALAPLADGEVRPRLVYAEDGAPGGTGNDVKLDRQMARLAQNTLFHQALVQVLGSRFAAMKQAIPGRV
jgi:flagellar basal-body rod protein FlgB